MAFDRPIEADRVDNLGLLSSFVSAPIVGPLMWILGRNNSKKEQEEEVLSNTYCAKHEDRQSDSSDNDTAHLQPMFPAELGSHNHVPGALGSDASDSSESTDFTLSEEEEPNLKIKQGIRSENNEIIPRSGNFKFEPLPRKGLKKTRKMSWSDESGQSLVEYRYCDESQSSPDRQIDASAPQTSRKPIKSAMRTSRVGNNDRRALHPSKCVPSMPSGGVLLPMKPGNVPGSGPVAGGNGYVSPQWGWYISTTPPTPEKYYHAGKKPSQQPSSLQIMHPTPTSMPKGLQGERQFVSQTHATEELVPTPVFTRGKKGVPKNTTGWPSVPL